LCSGPAATSANKPYITSSITVARNSRSKGPER
jgi:hypothetical protein